MMASNGGNTPTEDELLGSDEIDSDDDSSMDTESTQSDSEHIEVPPTTKILNRDLKRGLKCQLNSDGGAKHLRLCGEASEEGPASESAPVSSSLTLRGYQEEVSEKILRGENDIIILPTGTGKTAVAVNLIQKHLEEHRGKGKVKVLFLAPRVVLAEQQFQYITEKLTNDDVQSKRITGANVQSMDMLKEYLTGERYSIVVATPQIIVNYFDAFKTASMTQFSLLVFDECHHTSGAEPYRKLLNIYLEEKLTLRENADSLPQLVGLTASVGVGNSKCKTDVREHLLSLCSLVSLTAPPTEVVCFKEQLEECQDPPLIVNKLVEPPERNDPFSQRVVVIMKEIVNFVKNEMKKTPVLHAVNGAFHPKSNYHDKSLIQKISSADDGLTQAQPATAEHEAVVLECKQSLQHLKIYHSVLTRADLATLDAALKHLKKEMEEKSLQSCGFYNKYKEEWLKELEELSSKESDYENRKLQLLREELDRILNMQKIRIDDGFASKVMIFVEYRWLARDISNWLNSFGDDYKSESFVSSLSKADDSMSSAAAERVMAQFRANELNILVATSVLSEGIDVPTCNGVIRYMYIRDVISEIQVPGRVRSKDGHVVAIFDKRLRDQYNDNGIKEKWMVEALQGIRVHSSDSFKSMMSQRQQEEYKKLQKAKLTKQKLKQSPSSTFKDATVNCRMCKATVGKFSDIHCYVKNHYIILDTDLQSKVELEVIGGNGVRFDGIMESGVLVCKGKGCHKAVGKLHNIKIDGTTWRIGKWDIKEICFMDGQGKTVHGKFKKWKEVYENFYIPDISHEELTEQTSCGALLEME